MHGTHTRETTCDVVVAGSGAGALAGALSTAAAGLDTLVLERTEVVGGTSAYSGASVWLPGSRVQQRAGIDDSTASARTYLEALLGDRERARREAFLGSAPEVVEALESHPALAFEWQAFPEYFDLPGRLGSGRSLMPLDLPPGDLGDLLPLVRPEVGRDRGGLGHAEGPLTGGRALIGRLLKAFTETGSGTVRTGTRVTGLVVEDGRVTGVRASTSEGAVRVHARRGVLLAGGGFEGDADLRAEHGVAGSAAWTMAPAGANTGDLIRAATEVGAGTEIMDQAWWCPGLRMADGSAAFTLGFRGGLAVDADGLRFANESQPYDRMGRAMAEQPGRIPAFWVFDGRFAGGPPAISLPGATAEEHLERGSLVRAGSLAGLAEELGLAPHALERTVERFNAFAARGRDDDFGRGEDVYDRFFADPSHGTPNPCLVPVDRPPYFAARLVLSDLGTKGGLRTDTEGRVLDRGGAPLPGLYAAGNTSASFTGGHYPAPGVPIGSAMVFAHRAALDMARH
ncbi:FAD-binding protein [Nocardiopsis sp. HNM0947]|uniref:FAD-binding protein n=1 Tax=Nocardiopsis coralli TaxID=2772213 RepID=A0ABR9NZV3_9ACTN|nr:FAD-dependent oxidoreductase [Nocardiopsis coralli]MBE2997088.1 FAD-binding protein [Nocardiopsis coralli]